MQNNHMQHLQRPASSLQTQQAPTPSQQANQSPAHFSNNAALINQQYQQMQRSQQPGGEQAEMQML